MKLGVLRVIACGVRGASNAGSSKIPLNDTPAPRAQRPNRILYEAAPFEVEHLQPLAWSRLISIISMSLRESSRAHVSGLRTSSVSVIYLSRQPQRVSVCTDVTFCGQTEGIHVVLLPSVRAVVSDLPKQVCVGRVSGCRLASRQQKLRVTSFFQRCSLPVS